MFALALDNFGLVSVSRCVGICLKEALASSLLQLSLPSIVALRTLLQEDMVATSSDFFAHHPTAPKDLPTILLNSTLGDTITHFNSLGYYPSNQVLATLRTIYNAKPSVLDAIEHRFGKRTLSTLTSAKTVLFIPLSM